MNLGSSNNMIDDRQQLNRAYRDQSAGSVDANRPVVTSGAGGIGSNGTSAALGSTPSDNRSMIRLQFREVLTPRRSRIRAHRHSADPETMNRLTWESHLPINMTARVQSNTHMSSTDDLGDRPIRFTGAQGRNASQPPTPSSQVVSLRSNADSDISDISPRFYRPTLLLNQTPAMRSTHICTNNTRFAPQHRVQNLESVLENHSQVDSDVSAHLSPAVGTSNRRSRVSISIQTAQPSRINPDYEQIATSTVNNNSTPLDREIRVRTTYRNPIQNASSVPMIASQASLAADNQSVTTSISDASSIEDLNVSDLVRSDQRASRSTHHTPVDPQTISSGQDTLMNSDNDRYHANDDWRTNIIGNRALWRKVLTTERFADVWFLVGGDSSVPYSTLSSTVSPDPGAPGGPTSQANLPANQNYTAKTQIRNTESAPSVDLLSCANNTRTVDTDDQQAMKSHLSVSTLCLEKLELHSDLDDTVDDATDLNSDTDQTTGLDDSSAIDTKLVRRRRKILDKTNRLNHRASIPGVQSGNMRSSRIYYTKNHQDGKPGSSVAVNDGSVSNQSGRNSVMMNLNLRDKMKTFTPITQNSVVTSPTQCVRFAAHRLILAAASPVFEAMFYGPMATEHKLASKETSAVNEYHIPDIHPKAFELMLLYIYGDEVSLNDDLDLLFCILYAAKKYMLPHLAHLCVEQLKEQINADNVCMILDRSLFFDEVNLTNRCWHVIDVLATDVFTSRGFLTLDLISLQDLVKRDTLNCKESDVFSGIRRWAEHECGRLGLRNVLSNQVQVAADILPLVRFPTMTLSDFAQDVAYSNYLSLETLRDLFVYITTKEKHKPPKRVRSSSRGPGCGLFGSSNQTANMNLNAHLLSPAGLDLSPTVATTDSCALLRGVPFPREPRTGPKLWRCARFVRTRKHLLATAPSNSPQNSVCFTVTSSIFLAGVGVYGSTQVGEIENIRVELKVNRSKLGHKGHRSQDRTNYSTSPTDQTEDESPERASRYGRDRTTERLSRTIATGTDGSEFDNRDSGSETRSSDHSQSKVSTVCLAKKNAEIDSDGTDRVYDVRFPCPVKIDKGVTYMITVVNLNGERAASMSTSPTAINSSSSFIGVYGKADIKVHCSQARDPIKKQDVKSDKNSRTDESKRLPTHFSSSNASSGPKPSSRRAARRHTGESILFHFSESWDTSAVTDVDHGFIPELLFFTSS